MTVKFEPKKYRVTRWRQLIFPQELIIDEAHVLTRKRHFPAFWIIKEESIPLSKVASIQILRGLFFSTIVIENSGGPFPIAVHGLPNRKALEVRKTLETYEKLLQAAAMDGNEPDEPGADEKKTHKLLRFLTRPAKKAEIRESVEIKEDDDEPLEAWWKEPEETEKVTFEPAIIRDKDRETREMPVLTHSIRKIALLDDRIDEDIDRKAKQTGWMSDIIKPPLKDNLRK